MKSILLYIFKYLTLLGSIYGGIWVFLDSIGFATNLKHAILIGCVSIFLTSLYMCVYHILTERRTKYFISPEDLNKITKLLKETKELKIFSSGSTSYRIKLRMILKKIKSTQLRRIEILIRDDNTAKRDEKIKEEIKLWKKDIGDKYYITIDFYRYTFSQISLRGYIFDKKYALLGWYYNDGDNRYGNDQTLVLYSSEFDNQREIVEYANKTFYSIFHNKKFNEIN